MIGESSGVSTLLTNERIFRESQAGNETRNVDEPGNISIEGRTDEVTISAEATALAQAVTTPTESSAVSSTEQQGREQETEVAGAPQFLDIRV